MKALERKLLRDLTQLWSQALTIALVVAAGAGSFITTLSAVDSLEQARERYYAEGHFAEVFAALERAPLAAAAALRELPGVADVQPTIEQVVRVELPGTSDPLLGQLIGYDPRRPPRINVVGVRSGRGLDETALTSTAALPALVSAAFADAHGLAPGARVGALVNGRQRTLVVSGIALSPEYIFAGLMGAPDTRGFGVFWVPHEALAAAYDMNGAFNRVALKLAPGARERDVVVAADALLARYGGREAHGRAEQTSHTMLDNEISGQRLLGTLLPAILLAVAAFLLHVVISRLVATQREQIAALKALGYPNRTIAAHYLKFVLAIVLAGQLLGVMLGDWMGTQLVGLYAEVFRFPVFEHRIAPSLLAASLAVTLATAVAGTLGAIVATVRLPPAEAMRPPAPGHYRRTWLERIGVRRIGPALRMILRNMQRRPLRTSMSVAGIAAAVAVVVLGNFLRDAIAFIVESQFNVAMRSDVILWLAEAGDAAARHEVARLPGVIAVEPGRDVPVRFVNGHLAYRGVLQGYPHRPELRRIIDVNLRQASRLDEDAGGSAGNGAGGAGASVVMTDRLADKLGLRVGQRVQAVVLEGRQRTLTLTLAATAREMMGLNAYMERRALNRALGEGDLATQFSLALERGSEPALLAAAKALPRVVGTFSKATLLRNMQEITARNIRIMSTIMTLFAIVIAVGVVYNNARIALAERTWELASLRVLGFTRAEVSALLLGELALCIALALPLGMLAGNSLVHALAEGLASDQFLFPAVVSPPTYAMAALAVLVSGAASALVVRRRIDRLDMVAALKTRE